MFYDLNLQRSLTNQGLIEYRRLLECSLEEEYHTVAVNKTFTDVLLGVKDGNDYKQIQVNTNNTNELVGGDNRQLRQLARVTIEISETKNLQQLNDLNSKVLETYDLIAVKAKNEKIFHAVCVEYDYYDIITFDMGEKIPYMLKRSPVYEAIRKALFDPNKKRVCLTNCLNIIKATKGKNLIVSSDTSSYDLCSLLISLGLKKDQAYKCLTQNPKKCVATSKYRKSYKGTIQVITPTQIHGFKKRHLQKIQKFNKLNQQQHNQMVQQNGT